MSESPTFVGPANFVGDRKSTRLNSSHGYISYAVFCLKKNTNEHIRGDARLICLRRHLVLAHAHGTRLPYFARLDLLAEDASIPAPSNKLDMIRDEMFS